LCSFLSQTRSATASKGGVSANGADGGMNEQKGERERERERAHEERSVVGGAESVRFPAFSLAGRSELLSKPRAEILIG